MMSIGTIKALSDERAKVAAQERLEPYTPFDAAEIDGYPPFPFPNIGDYEPEGWTLVDTLFCDSSGMGADNEPALTIAQLIRKLHANLPLNYGYAIVQEGQFQVQVGVFGKTRVVPAGKYSRKQQAS